jgi:hypothetical protein
VPGPAPGRPCCCPAQKLLICEGVFRSKFVFSKKEEADFDGHSIAFDELARLVWMIRPPPLPVVTGHVSSLPPY